MVNREIFNSFFSRILPETNVLNAERSPAYAWEPKAALAQYVVTGCLSATFYANAEEQFTETLRLCEGVETEFLVKLAVYSRREGWMKDMPALLCAVLAQRDVRALAGIFNQVIDSGKMLRNFVQIVRSGRTGRKSMGTAVKRLIQRWIEARTLEQLLNDSVGENPSLADIIKMVHPCPQSEERAALYAYLLGKEDTERASMLPSLVREYEAFKLDPANQKLPEVPFQLLTSLPLSSANWVEIARTAPWQMTRMNLNTFARHGVYGKAPWISRRIAERLRDRESIRKARAFPYQLMTTWKNCVEGVPIEVRDALQDAMEFSIARVPEVAGKVVVCPDVSGSMSSPVTGYRRGATTGVRCIDVAALVAAAVVRRNSSARVIPFAEKVIQIALNSRDSVMTQAEKLAAIGGGGTNCSAPLRLLNEERAKADLVILVSDNQSWLDAGAARGPTSLMKEWEFFKYRNPRAKLVCLDIQPYANSPAAEREDILNIGGFSDAVFEMIGAFVEGKLGTRHWLERIEGIS